MASIALAVAFWKAVKSLRSPPRKRDSSSAVCTVTSAAAIATHSSTVRTLEPISSPASQQSVMKRSVAWRMLLQAAACRRRAGAPARRRRNAETARRGHSRRRPPATARPACRSAARARAGSRRPGRRGPGSGSAPPAPSAASRRSARAGRPCRRDSGRAARRRVGGAAFAASLTTPARDTTALTGNPSCSHSGVSAWERPGALTPRRRRPAAAASRPRASSLHSRCR